LTVIDQIGGCLNGLSGDDAKWKLDTLFKFYADRAFDPGRLMKDLDDQYLAPTLKALEPWFKTTSASWMADGKQLLDNVMNGKQVTLDLDWATGLVDKGWNSLANESSGLVAVSGMGGLKCLKQHFGMQVFKDSKLQIAQVVLGIVKPASDWLASALHDLSAWFQEKVSETAGSDDWFGQLAQMTKSAIKKTCMDKYESLNSTGGAVTTSGTLDMVKVSVNMMPLFFGKLKAWSLHHVVQPLARELMRLSKDISNMIMHGVDALSGLIPFWGGLVGALASSAGSAAKHLESTFSYKSIVAGFEQLFALVEKEVTQLVQKTLGDLKQAMMNNPVGKVVLQLLQKVFKKVAGPLVVECEDSIQKLVTLLPSPKSS